MASSKPNLADNLRAVLNSLASEYDLMMFPLEALLLRGLRRRMVGLAEGQVLELGAGTGRNLAHYAPGARLVATELSEEMLRRARRRPTRATAQWVQADAQALPFAAERFDYVLGTLLFCSIPDPPAALAEVKRVLRPQGWLLLLEHVRGEASWLRTLTNALDRPWYRFTQSCHLNRDTAAVVAHAGLRVVSIFPFWGGLFQIIVARKDA